MGEIFDYPGRYRKQSQGEAIAALRLDGHHEASQSIVATGNPWGLGVGHIVTVPNPPESDDPIKYLVTSAHYELRMPEERSGGAGGDEPPYTATYSLLPTTEQFRPQRVNVKPAIVGPQTAIVVGENKNADPDPEEIVTDSFGRVRVRFHWERVGPRHPESRGKDDIEDEDNTCWIRVAQLWAGSRWGAQFLPRVGQEVVVEFLEGDPDRPLITGSVYNNVNMPPYKLTDHKTQSGIKSRSTKGGTENNFNEIRFEDLKGKEELHMQAELDMSTNVKRNQTLYVGGDQNVTIHGNQIVSVHGTDEKTGKKLPVQSVTTVTGKHTFDASDTIKIQAPTSITLECGGSTIVLTPGSITLTSGGKSTVVLDTEVFTKARGGANTKHNADVLHKSNAGAQIKLDTNVLAKSVPGAQLQLDDKVGAKSVPGSELTLDGNATLSGKGTATVQAPGGVTVSGGGGTVKADPSGVTASGTKVSVSGAGMVNIAGGIVKIN
jgi:type VI secretion system secreted protein VgrG